MSAATPVVNVLKAAIIAKKTVVIVAKAQQQTAETRESRQQAEVTEKARTTDEQQAPRRERSRRRNDDKRQAQQEAKALNVEEQSVQETEQEERVRPVQPRRKQRQLNQKVRYEQSVAEEAVVAPVVEANCRCRTNCSGSSSSTHRTGESPAASRSANCTRTARREQC